MALVTESVVVAAQQIVQTVEQQVHDGVFNLRSAASDAVHEHHLLAQYLAAQYNFMLECRDTAHFQAQPICRFCVAVAVDVHVGTHGIRADGGFYLLVSRADRQVGVQWEAHLRESRFRIVLVREHVLDKIGQCTHAIFVYIPHGGQAFGHNVIKFFSSCVHNLPPFLIFTDKFNHCKLFLYSFRNTASVHPVRINTSGSYYGASGQYATFRNTYVLEYQPVHVIQ